MTAKKVITLSLSISIIAELFLIFIIYLNPYKIEPLYDPAIQMWVNAGFNFLSFICLLLAYFYIKRGNKKAHILSIHMAMAFSALFLINYIFYHMSVGHVKFQNADYLVLYLIILASHLLISVLSLPLIFMTYGLGMTKNYDIHKKIAPYTFAMWSYVGITGVIVVLMLKYLN